MPTSLQTRSAKQIPCWINWLVVIVTYYIHTRGSIFAFVVDGVVAYGFSYYWRNYIFVCMPQNRQNYPINTKYRHSDVFILYIGITQLHKFYFEIFWISYAPFILKGLFEMKICNHYLFLIYLKSNFIWWMGESFN